MNRSRLASLVLAALLLWLTGCHSYKPISIGELPVHRAVRVTLTDGERTELDRPGVIDGMIWGERNDGSYVAFYPDSITRLEAKSANVAGTMITVIGVTLLVAGGLFAIGCAASDCTGSYSCIC